MTDHQKHTFDCTDLKTLLSAMIDDEIDDRDRYRAERHLAACRACRELVSEAELNDAMIVLDGTPEDGDMPPGFVAAVLGRTVYADRRRSRQRWTAALGWFAAAASFFLAVSVWVLNRPLPAGGSNGQGGISGRVIQTTYASGPELRSWALEGPLRHDLPPLALGVPVNRFPDPSGSNTAVMIAASQRPPVDVVRGAVEDIARRRPISPEAAETLDSAAALLTMLEQGSDRTFRDVDFVRRVTEYDDLLTRLADARHNLPIEDWPALLGAETILHRVVAGPLSVDDMRELRQAISRLDLRAQISAVRGADRALTSSL